MRTAFGMVFVVALTFPAGAWAQAGEEQRGMACMGDALQLCSQFIPDHEAIKRCLGANHAQLTPACRTVFDAAQRPGRRRAS